MLSVLGEDILESLAEAFRKRVLNVEGEFIWKAPKDSPHVVTYPYDHGPDRLDDFRMRSTRAEATGVSPGPTCGPGVECWDYAAMECEAVEGAGGLG